jgi:hypothetical protein
MDIVKAYREIYPKSRAVKIHRHKDNTVRCVICGHDPIWWAKKWPNLELKEIIDTHNTVEIGCIQLVYDGMIEEKARKAG